MLALNVAPLPRGPLLEFDVHGPLGDAWLLPRLEIAARQGLYLEGLAASFGQTVSPELRVLLAALLGFTGEWFADGKVADLEDYLKEGFGDRPPDDVVQHWRAIAEDCRDVLRPRLDEFRNYSAPENPAMVLPELFANGQVNSFEDASRALEQYRELLRVCDEKASSASPNAANDLLNSLADYGNNFDLIVAMLVPLDEPFMVKFSERRDLSLSPFRNLGTQDLVIADAQTNHVTFKVTDANVRIGKFSARQPGTSDFAYGAFQAREDQQGRAIYAHDAERDYRIRLTFRLAFLRRLQVVPYLAAAILFMLVLALLHERPGDLKDLALIVGPSALAASVLLAREPSTLGSRLRQLSSIVLAVTLAALILIAAILYVSGLIAAE
ncbi:hypothetical protein GCM10022239_12990 [Leifsonia bigeumensis]|uniref:Uncharacterized protein n=1 Tax=Leifsonella bigeumensis TaxID=433643 RepID=A0ABP7FI43_9MICO